MVSNSVILIRNASSFDFGGGERFPVLLAEILLKNDIEPIIMSRHKTLLEFAESKNIKTIRSWWWNRQNWSGWRVILLPMYLLWQICLFSYYLVTFTVIKPEAIHIQSKDDFIGATLAGRLVGAQVIWTDHADLKHVWKNISVSLKNPVGKIVYFVARFAHAITVVSKSEQKAVTSSLPKNTTIKDKIQVVYNGSPDKKYEYPRKKHTVFMYGVVSRLVFDKGVKEAIRAFEKIHAIFDNTELLIVGTGPDENALKDLAKNKSAIRFVGHQTDPLAYMAKLDVLLQPTYHEGFSVTLVEATMMGLPIIATDVGGNPEIIKHQETGLLVPARDIDALFEAMIRLYDDSTFRDKLAKNARNEYMDKFVFEDIVKGRFLPLYE